MITSRTNTTASADWETKLIDIEKSVRQKSNDLKLLSTANTVLEAKCAKLQQELTLVKLRVGEQIQAEDDILETRDFQKRCGNLESELRRKTREVDLIEGKIQNQTLLEEELGTATIKLKLSYDNIEKLKKIETLYYSLIDEKREWSVLFKGILNENENTPSFGTISELGNLNVDISPTSQHTINPSIVLRALGSIQMKYVLLLKSQSEFESTDIELRKDLELMKSKISKCNSEKDAITIDNERVMSKLRLAQRQVKLFEGEVSSLRSLLSSFDVEFSIGRPADDTLFSMKDRVIAALQTELDITRNEANEFCRQAQNLEEKILSVRTTPEGTNVNLLSNYFSEYKIIEIAIKI